MAEVGEALVATAIGILVALPAIAAFNYFQRMIKARLARGKALGREVMAYLKSGDAGPVGARRNPPSSTTDHSENKPWPPPPKSDDEIITGINVTPLVDITLVLLVILMVTASYVASKTIPLELPKGATAETTPTTLSVSIDKDGKTYLDAAAVDDGDAARPHPRGPTRRPRRPGR